MAAQISTTTQPTRNGAPLPIPDIEIQLRENNALWGRPEYEGHEARLQEQETRLLTELEAAPIASASDAVTAMRVVLDELPLFYKDELARRHPKVADGCLRKVLTWLEAAPAAPRAITGTMVADAIEAELAHRHAGAEQRVRAILTAALAAEEPAEPLVALEAEWKSALVVAEAAENASFSCFERLKEQGATTMQILENDERDRLTERAEDEGMHAYGLLVRISETPTRTLAGARVKARTAAYLVRDQSLFDMTDSGSALVLTLAEALEALA